MNRKVKLTSRKITDSQTILKSNKYLLAQEIKRFYGEDEGWRISDAIEGLCFKILSTNIDRDYETINERLTISYRGVTAYSDLCYHWDCMGEDRGWHILEALKEIDKELAKALGRKLRAEQRRKRV